MSDLMVRPPCDTESEGSGRVANLGRHYNKKPWRDGVPGPLYRGKARRYEVKNGTG